MMEKVMIPSTTRPVTQERWDRLIRRRGGDENSTGTKVNVEVVAILLAVVPGCGYGCGWRVEIGECGMHG